MKINSIQLLLTKFSLDVHVCLLQELLTLNSIKKLISSVSEHNASYCGIQCFIRGGVLGFVFVFFNLRWNNTSS